MNYCSNCGNKLDEDSEFCSNCGNKLNADSNTDSKKVSVDSINNNFIDNLMSNPKLIILALVVIIAVVGIISLVGSFNGDLVDVTSIEMSVGYSDTPFGGAIESAKAMEEDDMERLKYLKQSNPSQYQLELDMSGLTDEEVQNYKPTGTNHQDYQVGTAVTKFSLMPRDTITRVTGLALYNTEVTLGNGKTENWGTFTFNPNDMYVQDTNYKFSITHTLKNTGENIDEYYSISHIKADIVMNTTDAKNKVIGHINEDITPNH